MLRLDKVDDYIVLQNVNLTIILKLLFCFWVFQKSSTELYTWQHICLYAATLKKIMSSLVKGAVQRINTILIVQTRMCTTAKEIMHKKDEYVCKTQTIIHLSNIRSMSHIFWLFTCIYVFSFKEKIEYLMPVFMFFKSVDSKQSQWFFKLWNSKLF